MPDELNKLPLHDSHVAAGATMGEEGGWTVPVRYAGALAETEAAQQRAGVMDLSHLGRIRVRGDGALGLLERVCTADVARQEDDTALHTLLLNERGGIVEEGFLIRLSDFWVLTLNAGNREKVLAHLQEHSGPDVRIDDQTAKVCHLAVVGPQGRDILNQVLPIRIDDLPRGAARMGSLMIANYIAARVAYSRLWGLEVMLPAAFAARAWKFITAKAGDNALTPMGMAARDILRVEAGLCRYGHETHEAIDPITAGLGACVSFDHDFLGAEAVKKIADKGPGRRRVLLKLTGGGESHQPTAIPKLGQVVFHSDGREIGNVTSATFSPAQQAVLAMAYISTDAAEEGAEVFVAETKSSALIQYLY